MKKTRISKHYSHIVIEDFLILYNYNNIMQLPKINQINISTNSKDYLLENKNIINAFAACFLLTGQKGLLTRAHKSIAAFKLRKDSLMGCMVTMRRKHMYAFLDKLIIFVLPRMQTLYVGKNLIEKGISLHKNEMQQPYNFGINNCLLLPEIERLFELFHYIKGLNVMLTFSKNFLPRKNIPSFKGLIPKQRENKHKHKHKLFSCNPGEDFYKTSFTSENMSKKDHWILPIQTDYTAPNLAKQVPYQILFLSAFQYPWK